MAWPSSDEDSDSDNEGYGSDESSSENSFRGSGSDREDESSDSEDESSDMEDESNPLSLLDIAGKKLLHLWTDGHLWSDDDQSNDGYLPSNEEIYSVMTLGKILSNPILSNRIIIIC